LSDANPKESKKINNRSRQTNYPSDFRESKDMKGSGVADLFTPTVKEEVGYGEKQPEEQTVRKVKW
jgi:hypothetical protein